MGFGKKKGEVFTLTLPLKLQPFQRDRFDKVFRVVNKVKNKLITIERRKLDQMTRTKEWRYIQKELAAAYDMKDEDRINELISRRNEMMKRYGLDASTVSREMTVLRKPYKKLLPSAVMQKVAASVWASVAAFLFSNGEELHHSSRDRFYTLEGKSNLTNLVYRDGCIHMCGVSAPVLYSRKDAYGYEAEAMRREIHYCKITRRWYPEGWRYFAQLVLDGAPPVKVKPDTGELLHPIGSGRVGIDIGPQTVAIVSDDNVRFEELAAQVQSIEKELRRVNRAMDRSSRAMNPDMYYPNGTRIPEEKLPPDKFDAYGRIKWVNSKRYKRLKGYRKYLYQHRTLFTRLAHQTMANRFLGFGGRFFVEKMNWQGLSKRTKNTERSEKTGKYKRKKRFGKSIGNKSPAWFINTLAAKAAHFGGSLAEVNTAKVKASQYDHMTGSFKKKALSKRWHTLPDGRRVQRDLYSAFLIKNVSDDLESIDQNACDSTFEQFYQLHQKEIDRLSHIVRKPASMGIKAA